MRAAAIPADGHLMGPGSDYARPGYLPPGYGYAVAAPAAKPAGSRAMLMTVGAICVGAVVMALADHIESRQSQSDPALRYGIVLTFVLYFAVGTGLLAYLYRTGERLRWRVGRPLRCAALGVVVGGGTAIFVLALNDAWLGHLSSDPRVLLIVSDGSAARIVAALLLTVIAAPLVEETLFRGVFAESLRRHGAVAAVVASAAAFAVWHLNPAGLSYYAVMGVVLGTLYWRRGLVASMAAHATFNGLLTLTAVVIVLGPAHTYSAAGVTLRAPGDWSAATPAPGTALALSGPAGTQFDLMTQPEPDITTVTPDTILATLQRNLGGRLPPGVHRSETVSLPAGQALELDATFDGHPVTIVALPTPGQLDVFMLTDEGNARAERELPGILDSVQAG